MPDTDNSILSLAPIFLFSGESSGGGLAIQSSEFGVNVQAYGLGQLTGAIFSVPPGGEIEVDFKLRLQCVTGEAIKNMDNLIKSLLDAWHWYRLVGGWKSCNTRGSTKQANLKQVLPS